MKILHVISSLKMGGAETALFNWLQYAVEHGQDEHVVAYMHAGPYVERIAALGIPLYSIAGWVSIVDPGSYYALCTLVRKVQPDVLHTSLWAANLLGRFVAYRYKIPMISEIHGDCRIVSARWKNYLEAKTMPVALQQKIIAVSHLVANAYTTTVIGAITNDASRAYIASCLTVVPNAIDPVALTKKAESEPITRSAIGFSENDFIIGAVGRLVPVKSYDLLLRAFSIVRTSNMKICLIGDGSERPFLEALAEGLHIREAVYFMGERTDAYRFYPLFDCFAISSQTEGLSLALLEALAFGLPIITTHQTINHEVIIDQVHGFVVPDYDIAAYAQAIRRLFDNGQLRSAMRRANVILAKNYSMDALVDTYQKIVHAMISQESSEVSESK